jgi:hypothetical protein
VTFYAQPQITLSLSHVCGGVQTDSPLFQGCNFAATFIEAVTIFHLHAATVYSVEIVFRTIEDYGHK